VVVIYLVGRGEWVVVVVVARVVAEGKAGRERREWMDGREEEARRRRGGGGEEEEEWPSSPCASSLSVRSNLDPSILRLSVLCMLGYGPACLFAFAM